MTLNQIIAVRTDTNVYQVDTERKEDWRKNAQDKSVFYSRKEPRSLKGQPCKK